MISPMLESIFLQISPQFLKDHLQISIFIGVVSYILFFYNWLVSTSMEEKFNLVSLLTALLGLLHLHYSNAIYLIRYEVLFVSLWSLLLFHHVVAWYTNYQKVMTSKAKSVVRKRESIVARFFITLPTTQNAVGHWEEPPYKNTINLFLMGLYTILLLLHAMPIVLGTTYTPVCFGENNLCCRYNYVMEGFLDHTLSRSFCSAHVNIAFAGSWSTGKTYLINGILGHEYATAQSAPAPTTDKFTCITTGSPYRDVVRSDDYERRMHCEIMSHVGDVIGRTCKENDDKDDEGGPSIFPNVLDVADDNVEFEKFVFFDMPGYQREYGNDCKYRNFYKQLIDKVDYTFVVWDVSHGKIEDEFAEFFKNKARGTNYDIIYNRFDSSSTDMGFLNQQYAKMSGTGQEMLSEMYITKVHENITTGKNPSQVDENSTFQHDIQILRSKIKGVNQTVHDNRKKLMKANLIKHEGKLNGFLSLYRLKMSRTLVEGDLNLHVRPKKFSLF